MLLLSFIQENNIMFIILHCVVNLIILDEII